MITLERYDGDAWAEVDGYIRSGGLWQPFTGGAEPPDFGLLGVGSASNSLATYPKITPTIVGNWYVDGSVGSSGNGTSPEEAFQTIGEGLAALSSGQTLLIMGGTYNLDGTINRNVNWPARTRIMAYGDDRPVLNAASITPNTSALQFDANSRRELWHRFHVINAPYNNGGNTGQVVRVVGSRDLTLSDIWVSHCRHDGIVTLGGQDIIVMDSAVWRLGDGSSTGTNVADSFSFTANSGQYVERVHCVRNFAANSPDDSFDFFRARNSFAVDCVSFRPGRYWNNSNAGDGNSFKLGGGSAGTNNTALGNIAILARRNGFDCNQAPTGNTLLANTAVQCGAIGFDLNHLGSIARDNLSIGNGSTHYTESPNVLSNNSWQLGITNPLFGDPGEFDWSLLEGSPAIGAGVSGGNLGASTVALAIAKEWLAKDLT